MNVIVPCREQLSQTRGRIVDTETGMTLPVAEKLKLMALLVCSFLMALSYASAQTTNVYVDPSANWVGYINDWATTNLPITGGPFAGGATALGNLDAGFAGAVASFAQSTLADPNPSTDPTYPKYWNADGTPNAI